MCSSLPEVAISFINTGIPIFVLPYLYFSFYPILLTLDVSAHHMIGRNIVPYFSTSLTCIFSMSATGVLIIISDSFHISYKTFSVFGS